MEVKTNNTTDKLTDEAFSRIMITSVLSILICIICLCSVTYAWFTMGVESGGNVVQAGRFVADVNVIDDAGEMVAVTVDASSGKTSCTLEAGKVYAVSLSVSEDSTVASGHGILEMGGESYKTAGVYADSPLTFSLSTEDNADAVDVSFVFAWGIPAEPYFTSN